MDSIVRIKYSISMFNVVKMKIDRREVFEFFPDGKMQRSTYEVGNRRCVRKTNILLATGFAFKLFCEQIDECISTANTVNWYVDDADGKVEIYYKLGRKVIVPRGYGTEEKDCAGIISVYLAENNYKYTREDF